MPSCPSLSGNSTYSNRTILPESPLVAGAHAENPVSLMRASNARANKSSRVEGGGDSSPRHRSRCVGRAPGGRESPTRRTELELEEDMGAETDSAERVTGTSG